MKIKILIAALTLMTFIVTGCGGGKGTDGKFRIITSFYPMYLYAINLTKGINDVEVVNLTAPQTGCLHDYQLTTEDMKTLSTGNVLVVNGFGMENFLDKAAEVSDLKIIDLSKDNEIRPIVVNDEPNPHVWLSLLYAKRQVIELCNRLSEIDPDHSLDYKKNALDYVTKLDELTNTMHDNLDFLPNKDIVTFHEAFPYFANEFDLNIISVIEREPGTEPSPKELAETIDKLKDLPVKVIFTEPQYSPSAAETIANETGAKIYTLDPIVTGEAIPENADDYINKMRQNMRTLQSALK
ncbi:MAG: zinc ABC transporter substrate-binding protein [Selenomonadaceae bacterium]|nr:zinc ABC transporter substrate-binding protein [Selenomonadaceae bacterium]